LRCRRAVVGRLPMTQPLRPFGLGRLPPVLDIVGSTDDVSSPCTLLASKTHSPASELAGVFLPRISATKSRTLSKRAGFSNDTRILGEGTQAPYWNNFRLGSNRAGDPQYASSIGARVRMFPIKRARHDADQIHIDPCFIPSGFGPAKETCI